MRSLKTSTINGRDDNGKNDWKRTGVSVTEVNAADHQAMIDIMLEKYGLHGSKCYAAGSLSALTIAARILMELKVSVKKDKKTAEAAVERACGLTGRYFSRFNAFLKEFMRLDGEQKH